MKPRRYVRHGMTGTKIYNVWKEMHRRCLGYSRKTACYKKRKISVCEEWNYVERFLKWAFENGYKEGLQIDRIDNDKGYSPDNCHFVTPRQNANNRVNTVYIEYKGERLNLLDWSQKLGIHPHTIYTRLQRGWTVERALNQPVQKRRKNENQRINN